MPVIAGARDPRSIITPDAFEVEPDLLGRPLATPRQRLIAILIDLAVIGLITLATKSFGIILGIVAAVFFVRAGFKRTPVRGSVFNRAMRLSVGCLGLFIAMATALGWLVIRGRDHGHVGDITVPVASPNGLVTGRLGDAISLVTGSAALQRARTSGDAREALGQVVERLRGLGLDEEEIRQSVTDMVPKDRAWSDSAASIVDAVLSAAPAAASTPAAPGASPHVSGLSTPEALDAYAKLLRSGADDRTSRAKLAALRSRLADTLAADTLRALQRSLDVERELAAARAAEATTLKKAAEGEKKGGGIFAWINGLVNELGFGFGWASIYLTIMTSWWKGQTVGKRIMKIRVLRLDGEPMTWWAAFERAGGYAAGFATGLLGFAQVYWDANRQCIHDRISGTVVVQDGAPKVLDWQDAI
jgi:hypothetical protein